MYVLSTHTYIYMYIYICIYIFIPTHIHVRTPQMRPCQEEHGIAGSSARKPGQALAPASTVMGTPEKKQGVLGQTLKLDPE